MDGLWCWKFSTGRVLWFECLKEIVSNGDYSEGGGSIMSGVDLGFEVY